MSVLSELWRRRGMKGPRKDLADSWSGFGHGDGEGGPCPFCLCPGTRTRGPNGWTDTDDLIFSLACDECGGRCVVIIQMGVIIRVRLHPNPEDEE